MMCFNAMHVGKGSKASEAELLKNVSHYDQLWLFFLLVMDNISIKMFFSPFLLRLHPNEKTSNNEQCLSCTSSQVSVDTVWK